MSAADQESSKDTVWGFWSHEIEGELFRTALASLVKGSRIWLTINDLDVLFQVHKVEYGRPGGTFLQCIGPTGSAWGISILARGPIEVKFAGQVEKARMLSNEYWSMPEEWDWWPHCLTFMGDVERDD